MTTKSDKAGTAPTGDGDQVQSMVSSVSVVDGSGDLLSLSQVDHALAAKMQLVNDVSLSQEIISVASGLS